MLDFSRIEGFDWDEGNLRKSVDKHGVTQAESEQIFQDPSLLVLEDEKHSAQEVRYQAYGRSVEGRQLTVSFTLRRNATLIRIISARSMSRKERARYEEEA